MPKDAPARKKAPASRNRGKLRRNVGLVIVNSDGKVLAGLRSHASGDKAWQLPQGGIEARETPLMAAYREIREETGITGEDLDFMAEMPQWTVYYLPREWSKGRRFIGQRQKWFVFRYLRANLPDVALARDREFEALEWQDFDWLAHHVIAFRQPVYEKVLAFLAGVIGKKV